MQSHHSLTTESRTQTGKGAARQLRARGLVPAVYYGPGKEATGLSVQPKELISALSTELGRNALVTLKIDGKDQHAMVQDVQVHPVTRRPLHVDFYKVDLEQPIVREVAFVAEGKAKGVVAGGELVVVNRTIPLRAKPGTFPARVVVDVTNLDIAQHIKVKDVTLPAGVEHALSAERNLVSCVTQRKRAEEDEAAAGAAPDAAAAAKAAAPAAKAAKPSK